ncbi:DpnI domain-containing protein [Rhodobacteraceae bacterium ASV31]|nr:DpnI domain-containing protein [Anianabacter salinae]
MKRGFEEAPQQFHGATQVARYDTENWAARWMYCPNCGNSKLSRFTANRPVADFYCADCGDQYELKSQTRKFGRKIANGAFRTKMERLASDSSPNLILLQ